MTIDRKIVAEHDWQDWRTKAGNVTTKTTYRDGQHVKVITELIGSRPLARLTGRDLDQLAADLRQHGYAPITVQNTWSCAKKAFRQPRRWRLIASTPWEDATVPPVPQASPQPASVAENSAPRRSARAIPAGCRNSAAHHAGHGRPKIRIAGTELGRHRYGARRHQHPQGAMGGRGSLRPQAAAQERGKPAQYRAAGGCRYPAQGAQGVDQGAPACVGTHLESR